MVEKLSIGIALEGGKEVERQLESIGQAGEKAFENIKADAAAESIGKVGEAASEATQKTEALGAAADQTAESFSQVSLESVKTGAEIAKVGAEIAKIGVEIGLAVKAHQSWIGELVKLASHASTAVRAVAALSPAMTAFAAAAGVAVAGAAVAVLAFEALEKAATKAAEGDEKLNHALQTLVATSGESSESLQRGQAAFQQIGISAETFGSTVGKIGEQIKDLDVAAALDTKGMRSVVDLVKEIAAGMKGIEFADWVTAEQKIEAVAVAMKQAADQGKNATQVLLEFVRNADQASAIKVGAAFGLSEADVDRVRRLKEDIGDLIQRIGGAGVLISPEAAAAFDKMRDSIQHVDSAWARLKQALDSTIFTTLAARFSTSMNELKASALNAAAGIIEDLNRIGNEAIRIGGIITTNIGTALKKVGQESGITGAFQGFHQGIQNSITGLEQLLALLVGGVMQGMQGAFTPEQILAVQNAIKGVKTELQGTNQTASALGGTFNALGLASQTYGDSAKKGAKETEQVLHASVQGFNSLGLVTTQAGTAAEQAAQRATAGYTETSVATAEAARKAQEYADATARIDSSSLTGIAGIWDGITKAIGSAVTKLLEYLGLQSRVKGPPLAEGGGGSGFARGGRVGGRGTGTSDSNLAWLSRGEYVMPARAVRQPGVLAFLEMLRRLGDLPGFAAGGLVGQFDQALRKFGINIPWNKIDITDELLAEAGDQLFGQGVGRYWLKQVKDGATVGFGGLDVLMKLLEFFRVSVGNMRQLYELWTGTAGGAATSMARGGLLGGRGSGTSDSNLAWVSRGEHIMPARAVRQPGVLAFLEALRRSGGNLRRVLDGMGRFALGGMVRAPAFAAGGLNGMSHVTIQFPGGPTISGLRASAAVVDELRHAAALAQVRSGGRKPSRYS